MSNMYVETNTNTSFPGAGATNASHPLPPITNTTTGGNSTKGGSGSSSGSGSGSGAAAGGGSGSSGDAAAIRLPVFGAVVAAGIAMLGALL